MAETEDGETAIDSQKAYDIIEQNDILNSYDTKANNLLLGEMERCVDDRVDFETKKIIAHHGKDMATSAAIETFSSAMYRLNDLLNTAITQLEKNGTKLFRNLTPKKMSKWANDIAAQYLGILRADGGTTADFGGNEKNDFEIVKPVKPDEV
jgi:hypothetical protein